jgi:four helix bundle protein
MTQFDHEKLDVYQVSLEFIVWSESVLSEMNGAQRHLRDQLTRAALSIPLNIAEGCGKRPGADRNRYYETARASALECAACLDVAVASRAASRELAANGKQLLARIAAMLIRLAPPDAK